MRLLGRTGQLAGRTVAVTGPLRIGRAPENELQLSVDGVSRQHASITPEGDAFWLEDLHSANGTFLNGEKIVARERLAHLDVITLGRLADLIVDARAASAAAASPAAVGDASLEAIDGPEHAAPIPIPPGEVTIGRQAPANVLIDSRVVSKLHARLRRAVDRLAIDDLDSPNGTFVNGARITTNHPLRDGDTISIAGVRSFRVRITGQSGAPPAAAPPAADAGAAAAPAQPAFSQEWKTRLVWSPEELAAVEAERARVIEEVRRTTGGLPGDRATGGEVPQGPAAPTAAAPARKTEFIGRDRLDLPPDFVPPGAPAPPAAAPPTAAPTTAAPAGAARKTEFIGRDRLDLPPDFVPPGAPVPPPVAAAPPAPPPAEPPAAPRPPAPAPVAKPASAQPGTSFFRAGADLPPAFADAPPPPASEAPTGPVTPPRVSVFCLRGALGEFVLPEGTLIVGRQDGVAVHIADRQVSRNHAAITVQNGQLTIEDHASANGTYVNGARVTTARALNVGDQVKFGDLVFTVAVKS